MSHVGNNMDSENIKADTYTDRPVTGIHVVAKPIGPICNLACEYCLYLEKSALFDKHWCQTFDMTGRDIIKWRVIFI